MAANFDDPNIAPYLEQIAMTLVRHLVEKTAASPVQAQLPVLG